ncbi:MAG: HEAT repeat domain-containing protein [Bdellovibrionota bacterium]
MKKILCVIVLCVFASQANASYQLEHQLHIEHWMKTLEKHPFVLMRINAARFLGDLQDRIAVPTLIRALEDKNADVIFASIRALGKLGDPSAIKPLYEISVRQEGTLLAKEATRSIEKIQSYLEFKKNQQEANTEVE